MDWHETKMSPQQMQDAKEKAGWKWNDDTVLLAQARITGDIAYKAGVERVVKWVEEHKVGCMVQDKDTWWHGILDKDWQAFKKSALEQKAPGEDKPHNGQASTTSEA